MAKSSVSRAPKRDVRMTVTDEELNLVENYRELNRWDRTFLFLILQSLAHGKWTDLTDKYSFDEIVKWSDLPKRLGGAK